MRTRRIIAAAMAAALTATVVPSYTTNRSPEAIPVYAASEEKTTDNVIIDGIKYDCFSDHAVVSAEQTDAAGEIIIPEMIEVPVQDGTAVRLPVTKIAAVAFRGNTAITKVVIPESVTKIENAAFSDCTSLEDIVIPECITDIENGIGWNTPAREKLYKGTDALVINGTVHEIKNKKVVEIPAGAVRTHEDMTLGGDDVRCIIFPEGFETVADLSFLCIQFEQLFFPSTLKEIGYAAFQYDERDKHTEDMTPCIYYAGTEEEWNKIKIGESNDFPDNFVFETSYPLSEEKELFTTSKHFNEITIDKCSADASGEITLKLPDDSEPGYTLTAVADGAFRNCSKITGIVVPREIYTIGKNAFEGCTSLTDIYYKGTERDWNKMLSKPDLPEGVTLHLEEGEMTDLYADISADGKVKDLGCWGDIYIGSEAAGLDTLTFEENDEITSVTIAEGVRYINGYAFKDCTKLKEVYIPKSMNESGPDPFSGCPALTDIWYSGTIDDWNNILGIPYIPKGVTLHCKDEKTGEYITAGTISIGFEYINKRPIRGVRTLVHNINASSSVVAEWVSNGFPMTIAVPVGKDAGKYSASHDIDEKYFLHTDLSEEILLSKENSSYNQTVIVDNRRSYGSFYSIDGCMLGEGESVIFGVALSGRDLVVEGNENGGITCKLLKEENGKSYYEVTANKAGTYTLTVDSDNKTEEESAVIEVGQPSTDFVHDYYSRAEIIEEPLTELTVGQSTIMTIYGHSYYVYFLIDGQNADSYNSGDNKYISVEQISGESVYTSEYAQFKITAKQPCKAELMIGLPRQGGSATSGLVFTVTEKEADDNVSASGKKGDANSDGKVTVADSVKILQYIANQNKYPMTDKEILLADIDGEKGITGGDAIAIQKIDAGIMTLE